MPVEFLSDEQAAAFASFQGAPTRDELRKYFFLDDVDRQRATSKRRDHNKLGFGVQIGAVRYLRRFLPDPRQVPAEVVDYVAEQLRIADPSCIKLYGQRDGTARTHAGEIEKADGWKDFSEAADDLEKWLFARSYTTGEGPKALFDAAVGELRKRPVLMPGVSVLARLVAGSLTGGWGCRSRWTRTCRSQDVRNGPLRRQNPARTNPFRASDLARDFPICGCAGWTCACCARRWCTWS